MYFNSYVFFAFITALYLAFLFFSSAKVNSKFPKIIRDYGVRWLLIFGSLVFYAYWNVPYVSLLIVSILANYYIGKNIIKGKRSFLLIGLVFNLTLLAYFKYANFIVADVLSIDKSFDILLPIGISFFTFQQIAYLIDRYRGKTVPQNFSQYFLFISFFPHLISGPLVMQQNIIPQLTRDNLRPSLRGFIIGISVFALGLFKKVIIADNISPYVDTVFDAAQAGSAISSLSAWLGSVGFGLQVYFDFSGYCDMALGLALLFNIRFPINFYSPYKSTSIIEFWHRWNITLSKFLRDYLYFPLGGNKHGAARQLINVMLVMLIGGLWHGASWMFVLWGALHGSYLVINHGFRILCEKFSLRRYTDNKLSKIFFVAVTYIAVTIAWVLFRADSMAAGLGVYDVMFNGELILKEFSALLNGTSFNIGYGADRANVMAILIGLFIVFVLPNTSQTMRLEHNDDNEKYFNATKTWQVMYWKLTPSWAMLMGMIFLLGILALTRTPHEFVYFQF